jgi:hypothetical protein
MQSYNKLRKEGERIKGEKSGSRITPARPNEDRLVVGRSGGDYGFRQVERPGMTKPGNYSPLTFVP